MKPLAMIAISAVLSASGNVAAVAADTQTATPQPGVERPSGGMLRTLPHGTYQCALPGDANGPAFRVVAHEEFRIFTASRYENSEGTGTYIMRGQTLTFTSGPKKGQMMWRVGTNQVRQILPDGSHGDLLCTRLGSR